MALSKKKRRRVEEMGGKVFSDVGEWLDLEPAEVTLIEVRTRLGILLEQTREALGMTQADVAERLGTGQARVSKIEHGLGTIDAQMNALFTLGVPIREVSHAISGEGAEA